jgi:hypothetical protein
MPIRGVEVECITLYDLQLNQISMRITFLVD